MPRDFDAARNRVTAVFLVAGLVFIGLWRWQVTPRLPEAGVDPTGSLALAIFIFLSVLVLRWLIARDTREARVENRRLESWLDATWSSLPDPVLVVDLEADEVVARNDAAKEKLSGSLTPEELGRDVLAEAAGERVPSEGVDLDLELPARDGRRLAAEIRWLPLGSEGGGTGRRALVRVRDRSLIERLERERRVQEQRLRSLVASVSDVIFFLDGSGNIRYESPAAGRVLGYWPGELTGKRLLELVHPEDRSELESLMRRVERRRGTAGEIEFRIRHRQEEWRLVEGEVKEPRSWSDLEGLVVTMRDVTSRREAERALRTSKEKYSKIFRLSPLAIFISTLHDGRILEANEGFENLLGHPRGRAVGTTESSLGIWDDGQDRERIVRRVRTTGAAQQMEVRLRTASGQEKYALLFAERIVLDGRLCVLVVAHDITQRKAAERKLEQLALFDSLTGLPNRNLFTDRLRHALDRAERHDTSVAVIFLDLDRFKIVNDTLGHAAGDHLLAGAAQRILECFRREDTVARIGGDEFAALLEGASCAEEAVSAAERLIQALKPPFKVLGTEAHIGASIGIAISSDEINRPQDLLRYGDVAMYRAKEREGSSLHVFDPHADFEETERLHHENRLREAIENGRLRLFYQPIFNLHDREIVGAEALVRWADERRGLVSPEDFIPLAEETGLITPLGEWVLDRACRDTSRWKEKHLNGAEFSVSVNLSACQFRDPALLDRSTAILRDWRIAPSELQLEITETVVLEGRARIEELSDLGLRVAIDDFGTGYSSLNYLKELRVHSLKIDRSFVSGIGNDSDDEAICRTVLMLAREMGLTVIAEGIENEEQLEYLRNLGCGLGQGFYFARPLPAGEFEELLAVGAGSLSASPVR